MSHALRTSQVAAALELLQQGDPSARSQLIEYASDRLRSLAAAMLRGNPVGRWEQSEDLLQEALVRLNRNSSKLHPQVPAPMLDIAALGMRQALIDFAQLFRAAGDRGQPRQRQRQDLDS